MRFEEISVTPELATKWLTVNSLNRPQAMRATNAIIDDIKHDAWQTTHQAIAFEGTRESPKRLLDGQKRLMAIVAAGRAVTIWVACECPAETFEAIDGVQPRQAYINAAMTRIEGIALSSVEMSLNYCSNKKMTAARLLRLRDVIGESLPWVLDRIPKSKAKTNGTTRRGPVLSVFIRAHYNLHKQESDLGKLDHFIRVFSFQQVESVRDNPILAVRKKLDEIDIAGALGRKDAVGKLERALGCYLMGKPIPTILKSVDEEQFPIEEIDG